MTLEGIFEVDVLRLLHLFVRASFAAFSPKPVLGSNGCYGFGFRVLGLEFTVVDLELP